MRKIFIFIFLFIGINSFSTPQIPDILIYNGEKYEWNGISPAFEYFEKYGFKPPKEAVTTSANYSIFIMTYEIIDQKLFLKDVEIFINKKSDDENDFIDLVLKSVFDIYFPNQERVLLDFYSNIQIIPFGKIIESTKNGWTNIHSEKYFVFEIKNGRILKEFKLNYKKLNSLKRKQFKSFKKTKEYNIAKNENLENLENYNEFRGAKFGLNIDQYLELIIFRLIKQLK